jgi:hypothetical protein
MVIPSTPSRVRLQYDRRGSAPTETGAGMTATMPEQTPTEQFEGMALE